MGDSADENYSADDSEDADYQGNKVAFGAARSPPKAGNGNSKNNIIVDNDPPTPYYSSLARPSAPPQKRRIASENKGPLQYWSATQKQFIYEVKNYFSDCSIRR